MSDLKITDLATGEILHPQDLFVFVDVHDKSMDSTGTTKKAIAQTLFESFHPLHGRLPLATILGPAVAVANSTTLTSLFPGAPVEGTLVLPPDMLAVGSMLRFDLFGRYGAVANSTMDVQVLLGNAVIGMGRSLILDQASGLGWSFDPVFGPGFQVQATGIAGKVIGGARFNFWGTGGNALNLSGKANAAPGQVMVDTTASLAIDLKVQWSVANPANTIQLLGGAIYLDY
jgi:hypothetical protein